MKNSFYAIISKYFIFFLLFCIIAYFIHTENPINSKPEKYPDQKQKLIVSTWYIYLRSYVSINKVEMFNDTEGKIKQLRELEFSSAYKVRDHELDMTFSPTYRILNKVKNKKMNYSEWKFIDHDSILITNGKLSGRYKIDRLDADYLIIKKKDKRNQLYIYYSFTHYETKYLNDVADFLNSYESTIHLDYLEKYNPEILKKIKKIHKNWNQE